MSDRITYLIGAGASAQALPVIKGDENGLPVKLKRFVEENRYIIEDANQDYEPRETLYHTLTEIAEQSYIFGTPDLYAKYLLETARKEEYRLLQLLISNFFQYEQLLKLDRKDEGRILPFLTTIANEGKLPNNINILSWNYDLQFEIVAKKLKKKDSGAISMIDGFYTWPNKEHGLPYNHEQPFLFHINGVCEGDITLPQNHIDKKSYFNFSNQKTSPISFAWEDEIKEYETVFIKERKRHLQNIARRTDILVVIGYSFPFFNRKIDKLIFESLMDSLERIYIQDKRAGMLAEEIKSKLPLMPDVKRNIVPITDCSYYHIPYEL